MTKVRHHIVKDEIQVQMSLRKVNRLAGGDVKISSHFVDSQCAVYTTRIVRFHRSDASFRHFHIQVLVCLVHDLSHRVIFLGEISIEMLHVLKVSLLLRTKFPPNIFLFDHTERECVLIRTIENVSSDVFARHLHRHVDVELQLCLNVGIGNEAELQRGGKIEVDFLVDHKHDKEARDERDCAA